MKSPPAIRRMVRPGLAWLMAIVVVLPLHAHHVDFITVTADFRTDRAAWSVTVSVETLRVLEETQSTALAADLQRSDGAPGAVQADVFRAASRYLGERLHFSTDAPREAVKMDYQFSLVSVPDAVSGLTDFFVVGRHDGELPSGARTVAVELIGSLRAILVRKVDGNLTGPALTLHPSGKNRTTLDVPALSPVAARHPQESDFSASALIATGVLAAVAVMAIFIRRAKRPATVPRCGSSGAGPPD